MVIIFSSFFFSIIYTLKIYSRVQCSIAGAVISLRDLPDKMNPIVRPLMDALKREENAELQVGQKSLLVHCF